MAESEPAVVSTPATSSPGWLPWVLGLALLAGLGLVGWRVESTARAVSSLDARVNALELSWDALKKARAAQSPLRLPDPTPSRTRQRAPGADGERGAKAKAKAPSASAERTAKAGKAGKAKAGR